MKRGRKFLTGVLLAVWMITGCIGAAAGAEEPVGVPAPANVLMAFSGVIDEVKPLLDAGTGSPQADGAQSVLVKNAAGELMNFEITPDTYLVTAAAPVAGAAITGYYLAGRPAALIYPPHQNAVVAAIDLPAGQGIKAERFNSDLVSVDNDIKINLAAETEIVSEDGTPFTGELGGRVLVVVSSIATASIPAQVTPSKIVALAEERFTVAAAPADAPLTGDLSQLPILVDGQVLTAPAPYASAGGVAMLPLRAVAEALGFSVTWEAAEQRVMLNNTISLQVGRDYYTYARMAPIELGVAPELNQSTTYVPLSFFTEVARATSADIVQGQIIINR